MSADTKIKICGMRTAEAAQVAAESGVDYMGFVFVEGVRRQLAVSEGEALISSYRASTGDEAGPQVVGLFRNQDADWVNGLAQKLGLDRVQLNGEEDDSYSLSMNRPVIRQIRIRPETTRAELSETVQKQLDVGRIVLLDKYDAKVPGGSGMSFDWSVAEGIAEREGVLLAGGLTPENVGDAIRQLNPWGVDISSGVETDGQKDRAKIRAFVQAVRAAD